MCAAYVKSMGSESVVGDRGGTRSEGLAEQLSAFAKLPDEIIFCILQASDPNSFASLVLLNRNWRRVSQQSQLYAQQLARCQASSAGTRAIINPLTDDQLPRLRREFAREVKRNLFAAYLRPQETIINLVSSSISSSAAFPGGEAFHFSSSPNGRYVLAYSTSRIYIIDVGIPNAEVKRELKILRRPASVTILDDGSLLAVLSTDHQVDIYNLAEGRPKHIQAVALDHPPRTIALSPGGAVLAAAYDGGVEVYSLSATAIPTDRRGVKCDAADALSFSHDGTQLLGTTSHSKNPSTVVLTAPYFNPGDQSPDDNISQLWTTSILFPNSSRDCSHAILLPNLSDDGSSWTFTYDRVFETFRAVRIDDLRNGTTYFTGPIADADSLTKLLPSTLPAATSSGDLVAAGFQGKEIWLYSVPEDLDAVPEPQITVDNESGSQTASLSRTSSGRSHTWPRDGSSPRVPQWQLLCDKTRNTFVEGRHVSSLEGLSSVRWVNGMPQGGERLVVTAPGGVGQVNGQLFEEEEAVDGGRLLLIDFDYRINHGAHSTLTIEVGEKQPEVLEEEHRDMDTEVAIVRRRTVAQRKGNRTDVSRSATIAVHKDPQSPTLVTRNIPPSNEAAISASPGTNLALNSPEQQEATTVDEQEALDAPYAHGSPRSGTTLRRAATAAAINRRLHPPRVVTSEHVQFRRADGREEHPHESDADNWVPPPPPYTKDPVPDLPEHLRNAVPANSSVMQGPLQRSSTQRSSSSVESDILSSLSRSRTTYMPSSRPAFATSQRNLSNSPNISSSSGDSIHNINATSTHVTETGAEDLYEVSPPRTPEPRQVDQIPSTPIHRIPRRPVPSSTSNDQSPPVIMSSNTLQPVSPIPQHVVTNSTGQVASAIPEHWEGLINSSQTARIRPVSTGSAYLTHSRLDADTPPRPNHDHHLTSLPPTTPGAPSQIPSEPVGKQGHRGASSEETSSTLPTVMETTGPAGVELPSNAQLARLNSRSGRPSSRLFSSSSRRRSDVRQSHLEGQDPNHTTALNGNTMDLRSILNGEATFENGVPQSTLGTLDTESHPHYQHTFTSNSGSDIVRRASQSHVRHSSGEGTYRPRVARLDTIHSVASQPDGRPLSNTTRTSGVVRQPSRAERSAAINIQEAKRRGWRGATRKKRKPRELDRASSAGWTDVSVDSFGPPQKEVKGGRCEIM